MVPDRDRGLMKISEEKKGVKEKESWGGGVSLAELLLQLLNYSF